MRFRWSVVSVLLAAGLSIATSPANAGSVDMVTIPFERAVAISARVVKAKVIGKPVFRFEGKDFASLEVRVESTLKGPAAGAAETLRIFNPGEWYQHTHAAAIAGGVVSYSDPHYATPVPARELVPGASLLFFIAATGPPAGFPGNAAFLICGEAYDRADKAVQVAMVRTAAFGDTITLKVGESALYPDGLQVQVTGHAHKRPAMDGPRKEMAELLVTRGTRSVPLQLGHVVERNAKETWEKRTWEGYQLELLRLTPDAGTTLRVRRTDP